MAQQPHSEDTDAVPTSAPETTASSKNNPEQDALPTRYRAPIRHAVPAAPPAHVLAHAQQNTAETVPAERPKPSKKQAPKKEGAVRQALRAATKTITPEHAAGTGEPERQVLETSSSITVPNPAGAAGASATQTAGPANSLQPTEKTPQAEVSPQRTGTPYAQAYTPKNLGYAFARLQVVDERDIASRRRFINNLIYLRLVILVILGVLEGGIISRYTTNMGWGFWLVVTIYAIVQVWPLVRPPQDASDASVYSVWSIFSLISFIGVGLVLSPITFLLLVLNWDGISLGLDPMIVLCTLGVLWLIEIALLSITLYKFSSLRELLAGTKLSIR